MTFLAAGWLALFAPLGVVAWIALRRQPTNATTTAAFLWRDRAADAVESRGTPHRPPAWKIVALAAATLAIIAMARPAARSSRRVAVIVDPFGFERASWDRVRAAAGDAAIELVVPGQPDATAIDDVRPTARSTETVVSAALARQRRPAIVLSDATSIRSTASSLVVRSRRPPPAIAIERIAARDFGGRVQVLVRMSRPDATESSATVVVEGVERAVQWSAAAKQADEIVSVDRVGTILEATVRRGDTTARARVVRDSRGTIRLATRGEVSEPVARFVETYARTRPSESDAPRVTVAATDDGRGPSVIVASGVAATAMGDVRRAAHPAIDGVPADAFDAAPLAIDPPVGFEPIAWRGERPIVAARVSPRSVWIGLDARRPSPAWVALLDAAVRWAAGASGDNWTSESPDDVPASGWRAVTLDAPDVEASPGVYGDGDDRLHAINPTPPAVASDAGATDDEIRRFIDAQPRAAAIVAWPTWAAAGLAAAAAGLAGGRRLDGFGGGI